MTCRKKAIIIVAIAVILLIMLFPFRSVYRDGGTVHYKALIYDVTKYHIGVDEYIGGWNIKIFGITVYDNQYTVIES